MSKCVFCEIINGESPGEILYKDEDIIIFKNIKPASKVHYLSVPIKHINNVNSLSSAEHSNLLKKMREVGSTVLQENGGNVNDILEGFHKPPFTSINHLHLHIISPASEIGFISGLIFKPNSLWFECVDQTLKKLEVSTKL